MRSARRFGGFRRIAAAICAALLAAAALAQPAGAQPLAFKVWQASETRPGSSRALAPIGPGFVGASIDYCSITQYASGPGAVRVLANLISGLAPSAPLLRVGGDGPEAPCFGRGRHSASPAIAAIRKVSRRLHAKLILGIDLQAHRPAKTRWEVGRLLSGLDPHPPFRYVAAFELGNEPDLFPRYGPGVPADRVGRYFSRYMRDFSRWAQIVRRASAAPHFPVAGPSLGRFGFPWITGRFARNLSRFVHGPARPRYVTFHSYPLFGSGDPCPNVDCPSMQNLLLDSSSHQLAAGLTQFAARVPRGRELRVDEMNSITGGGRRGVSNTFASALWALDTVFEMASAGVDGVNFHTFSSAGYALFSHPSARSWLVHPEYYGLLMFVRAAPVGSRLLRVTPDLAADGGPNVKVWATRGPDRRARVVIVNKDTQAHELVLSGPGLGASRTASVQVLQAPPAPDRGNCPAGYGATGLCATHGVKLGGRSFGTRAPAAPAGDATATGVLASPVGRCGRPFPRRCVARLRASGTRILVPAASAVLLIGKAPRGPGR